MDIVQQLLGRINLEHAGGFSRILADPRGLFVLLALVITMLYGLSVGKTKALVSLLAVYVAYLLTVLFPFLGWLQLQVVLPADAPILSVIVFTVFYVSTFLILSHSMMKGRLTLGEVSLGKVVLISIVQLGLISSIMISLLPREFGERAFGLAYPYLAGQRTLWLWSVASLLIMPFMKRHHSE